MNNENLAKARKLVLASIEPLWIYTLKEYDLNPNKYTLNVYSDEIGPFHSFEEPLEEIYYLMLAITDRINGHFLIDCIYAREQVYVEIINLSLKE